MADVHLLVVLRHIKPQLWPQELDHNMEVHESQYLKKQVRVTVNGCVNEKIHRWQDELSDADIRLKRPKIAVIFF